eukprot:5759469-Alexandrium_andersonii.AAC.1
MRGRSRRTTRRAWFLHWGPPLELEQQSPQAHSNTACDNSKTHPGPLPRRSPPLPPNRRPLCCTGRVWVAERSPPSDLVGRAVADVEAHHVGLQPQPVVGFHVELVEAVGADDNRSPVQEAPGGELLALAFLQLDALRVRLEERLVLHHELGSRLVHEDRRVAAPLVVLEVGLVRALH